MIPPKSLEFLLQTIASAHEIVRTAEDARDAFLEPILTALGINTKTSGTTHCSIVKGFVHITQSGSSRGYAWDRQYTFPLAIFNNIDPVAAAKLYAEEQTKTKAEDERAAKRAQIKELRKELGEE